MTIKNPHDELAGSALGPPRFSLRTLLAAMTALGCLFGLMTAVGTTWSLLVLFFACLVVAHVLGNSVGTRLRDRASRRVALGENRDSPRAFARCEPDIAGPERLTQRTRLSRMTPIATVGGALVGGTLGGTRFPEIYPDSGVAAVVLGTLSAAVLGAFAGFAASSFLSVAGQAIREALTDSDPAGIASHKPR